MIYDDLRRLRPLPLQDAVGGTERTLGVLRRLRLPVRAELDSTERRQRVELALVRLEEVDPARAELLLVELERRDGGLLRVEDRVRVAARAPVR